MRSRKRICKTGCPTLFALLIAAVVFAFSCTPFKASLRETPDKYRGSTTQEVLKFNPKDSTCAGFPALQVETLDGTCVGVVYSTTSAAFQPRSLMEIPGKQGWFLVTDFASWSTTAGKIWILKTIGNFGSVTAEVFLDGLSLPHQIVLGPGNRIYFSEDGAISSFPVSLAVAGKAIKRADTKAILSGLPPMLRGTVKNSMHPLKHFVFDAKGHLYLNIGAYTDHCNDFVGKACEETDGSIGGGRSSNEKDHGAVIRRYDFTGDINKGWSNSYRLVGRGLRNSMGLWFNSKGDLIQAENSRDFKESFRPYEELNLIPAAVIEGKSPPKHYGWPYCYNDKETSDEWKSFSFKCDPAVNPDYAPPFILLPPHGAPLGILKYTASTVPNLTGQLIVPLHGYRSAGHRILSFPLDPTTDAPKLSTGATFGDDDLSGGTQAIARPYPAGSPMSQAVEVVAGWYEAPGYRPRGAPVAMVQGSDGAMWITDDKNHAILRLSKPGVGYQKKPAPPRPNFGKAYTQLIVESPNWKKAYFDLVGGVLKAQQCQGCHDDYRNTGDADTDGLAQLRYLASMGNWILPKDITKSTLYTKMSPPGASAMPPKDKPFPNQQAAVDALEKVKTFVQSMPPSANIWMVKAGKTPNIVSLKKGSPGNRICGKLTSGYHVWALTNAKSKLGGVDVLEILVGSPSKIADLSKCPGDNAFFVAAGDLEPLLK